MAQRIIIPIADGFRDEEVIYPYFRLLETGREVCIATDGKRSVTGHFGFPIQGTIDLNVLRTEDIDGIVVPGGTESPDRLRQNTHLLLTISVLQGSGKLVAAICHGPWVLLSAGILDGRDATCYRGMKDDLINAGANYRDEEVIIDRNIITSRHPNDLPAFMRSVIAFLNTHPCR